MTTDLMTYEANGKEVELSRDTVKNFLVKGNGNVTDQEVVMFMNLCKYQGLNPFLNEAHLIKYSDKVPASIVVGKEAYMKRAQRQPDFERLEAGLIIERDNEIIEVEGSFKLPKDKLLGGWAKVYRKGIEKPMVAKVSIQEYSQSQSTWNTKPATMIRKVAIVQAIRETYPEQFGAMYIQEEVRDIYLENEDIQEKREKQKEKTIAVKQKLPTQEKKENIEIEEFEEDEKINKEMAEELFKYTRDKGKKDLEVLEYMKNNFNIDQSRLLTENQANEIMIWANKA